MNSIEVTDYNPDWPEHFASLHARIWPAISDVAESIEHVGSTSVPGLAAKPIIDLTIVVASSEQLNAVIDRLSQLGITHRGNRGIEGREVFTRLTGFPAHNLYACTSGCLPLRNHLAVRDALRESPALRNEYSQLKRALAKKFPNDIDSYIEGKSDFLLAILRSSGFSMDDIEEVEVVNVNPNKPPGSPPLKP